jgi:hypothetical protein
MTLICLDPCQWSLMSLITGNKVKKKPHKPRYCEKEKDKANKRILRSLSFDNNGLHFHFCEQRGRAPSKYVNKLAIGFYFFIPEVKQYGRS